MADAEGLSLEVGDRPTAKLENGGADRWRAGGQELVFHRDGAGRVDGFELNAGRVRKVPFRRR